MFLFLAILLTIFAIGAIAIRIALRFPRSKTMNDVNIPLFWPVLWTVLAIIVWVAYA